MKATKRPSAEITGGSIRKLEPFAWAPEELALTRVVLPVFRLRRKTSSKVFVSPGTMFEAEEVKATKRPSAEIEGKLPTLSFPCAPAELMLTRFVLWVSWSRTKMSEKPFV